MNSLRLRTRLLQMLFLSLLSPQLMYRLDVEANRVENLNDVESDRAINVDTPPLSSSSSSETKERKECSPYEEGNGACVAKVSEKVGVATEDLNEDDQSFGGWQRGKSMEELRKDPRWIEQAKANGVVVDPDEISRIRAEHDHQNAEREETHLKSLKVGDLDDGSGNLDKDERGLAEDGYYSDEDDEGVDIDYGRLEYGGFDDFEDDMDDNGEVLNSDIPYEKGGLLVTSQDGLKRTTIGVEQLNNGNDEERAAVEKVMANMIQYIREVVFVEDGYEDVYRSGSCVNKHELCSFWASVGECDANPGYMNQDCILACRKCKDHSSFVHTLQVGG